MLQLLTVCHIQSHSAQNLNAFTVNLTLKKKKHKIKVLYYHMVSNNHNLLNIS